MSQNTVTAVSAAVALTVACVGQFAFAQHQHGAMPPAQHQHSMHGAPMSGAHGMPGPDTTGAAAVPGIAQADGAWVALGKAIFFDASLSNPVGQSCASCHEPKAGFADPDHDLPVSNGAIPDRVGSRNAPSVAYAAFSPTLNYDAVERPGIMEGMYVGGFFWDGRAKSLEDQVKQPFLNPLEMNNPDPAALIQALRQAAYAERLRDVCGIGGLDSLDQAYDCVAKALAAYLRSPEVSPFTSKFDYWRAGKVALSAAESRGYALFTGKAKCSNCHAVDGGPGRRALFTNFGHQNTGVPRNTDLPYYRLPPSLNPAGEKFVDFGLGAALRLAGVSEAEAAREDGKFKIPSLRNCALTPPYMHNGVFKTLRQVVVFNNTRDVGNGPTAEVPMNVHRHRHAMDNTFGRLGLADKEIDDIVEFLGILSDGYRL